MVSLPEEQRISQFQFAKPVNRWPEALYFAHAQLYLYSNNYDNSSTINAALTKVHF